MLFNATLILQLYVLVMLVTAEGCFVLVFHYGTERLVDGDKNLFRAKVQNLPV